MKTVKTMKTMTAIVLLAACTTACSQQKHSYNSGSIFSEKVKGSKNYVTKEIRLEKFTKIQLTGSADVTYTQQAGKQKVEVYTSDNIVDLVDIHVDGGTLCIGFKKNVNVSYDKLEIRLCSEELDAIALTGSGDVLLKNGVETDELKLSITGSGDIDGSNIRCDNLDIQVSGSGDVKLQEIVAAKTAVSIAGSGDITLKGRTDKAKYSIAGSGDIIAVGLVARQVSAAIAGSGDITCHATEQLKARTSGSGSIGYEGNPQVEGSDKGVRRL